MSEKKKYYIGVSILNCYEVDAKDKEEAEDIAFECEYSDTRKEIKSTDDAGVEIFGMKKDMEQLVEIKEQE